MMVELKLNTIQLPAGAPVGERHRVWNDANASRLAVAEKDVANVRYLHVSVCVCVRVCVCAYVRV